MRSIFMLAYLTALLAGATLSAAAQGAPSGSSKHVWTNEDLEALRDKGRVAVSGKTPAAVTKNTSDAGVTRGEQPREDSGQGYRQQLQPLYAELARIDAEIAEMRRWQDGSYRMTGVWPLRFAGMPLNPADRITQLEARRREVRERISDLEDAARHAGVALGELR